MGWRTVADGGGWSGEGVLAPMYSGRVCLKCEEIYKLSTRFKFLLHHINISRLGIRRQSHIHQIFADESLFLAPIVYEYESGRESISAEDTLCFGAHRVWIRVRGGYVTFGWNYKPTPIETYRNPADRLCVAGIGSSNFHLADFGFGRLLWLSLLRSNFAECTFTVPTQFESRLYSIFFRAGSIFNWNYILYTSFFYIYFQKHNTIYT